MIPEGWRVGPLHTILERIDAGWSPQCESRPASIDEWGVLKVSAVTSGKYVSQENKALPPLLSPRPELEVRRGDVLLARANGVLELVGRSAFVRDTRPKLMLSDKILRLRPARGVASPEFLHMLLSFAPVRDALMTVTGGSHMRNVSQASLRELPLTYPPLPEQRKIAAILTSVDDAIEGTQAVIEQLGVVKKAMMAELLTRGIPGRHTKFKMTEIGEVPESWDVGPIERWLNNIIDYRGKSPPKTDSGVPLITAKNVRDGYINQEPREYIACEAYNDWMTRGIPENGDVLFTSEAPLGKAAPVPSSRIALGQRLLTLCPNRESLEPTFLLWLLLSPAFQTVLNAKATGSTVQGIKQSVFRRLPIVVPPIDEQLNIGRVIQSVADRVSEESAVLRYLICCKSALMSVLLTGEVRVQPEGETA